MTTETLVVFAQAVASALEREGLTVRRSGGAVTGFAVKALEAEGGDPPMVLLWDCRQKDLDEPTRLATQACVKAIEAHGFRAKAVEDPYIGDCVLCWEQPA